MYAKITRLVIAPVDAITQQELDDVEEIRQMTTGNTRSHLTTLRDIRNEVAIEQRFQSAPLTQRLSFNS